MTHEERKARIEQLRAELAQLVQEDIEEEMKRDELYHENVHLLGGSLPRAF